MLAQEVYDTLMNEVLGDAPGLELHQELRRYYRVLVEDPKHRGFNRYNWIRRTKPMVGLLKSLPKRKTPWRVPDAGCGLGTEAIF